MRRASLALLLIAACATGGSKPAHQPMAGDDEVPTTRPRVFAPPRLTVEAHRKDSLLAVEVTILAEGVTEEYTAYEDADTWRIDATDAHGAALQPVVAAPCKVTRVPLPCASRGCHETPRWNVRVTATRYYRWPDAPGPVAVKVEVPGAGQQQAQVASR